MLTNLCDSISQDLTAEHDRGGSLPPGRIFQECTIPEIFLSKVMAVLAEVLLGVPLVRIKPTRTSPAGHARHPHCSGHPRFALAASGRRSVICWKAVNYFDVLLSEA